MNDRIVAKELVKIAKALKADSYFDGQVSELVDSKYGITIKLGDANGNSTKYINIGKDNIPAIIKFLKDFEKNFPKAVAKKD